MRKIHVPIFEGEDTYRWVYCVERHFTVNTLMKDEKLMAAALCLEGKALVWSNGVNNDN